MSIFFGSAILSGECSRPNVVSVETGAFFGGVLLFSSENAAELTHVLQTYGERVCVLPETKAHPDGR